MNPSKPQLEILALKPDPRASDFLDWVESARVEICKALALAPESIQRSNYIATYEFEKKGEPKCKVTIGYGVNGTLISRVESEKQISSRSVNEKDFFKSPFGTMLMEAQWFWRTRD